MREELCELDALREQMYERGGMKTGKVVLKVYVVHTEEIEMWKVDPDMDVEYMIEAYAMEYETENTNVLLMKGKHIPGLKEVIASYLPEVQVYIGDCIDEDLVMTQHAFRAAVMWQRAKEGRFPWGVPLLPRPKGLPISYGPTPPSTPDRYHCLLRPAHEPEELYCVEVCGHATVRDLLYMLQQATGQPANAMLIVQEGRVLPTYARATSALPISFLVFGHRMDSMDVCVPHDLESQVSWTLSSSTASLDPTSRGGARAAATVQQPRSVMIMWAEDKVSREVPGLNTLTVRMLLRAEQRTVSAVLHARSATQTREVMCAAYRRAGLNIDGPAAPANPPDRAHQDLATALAQQTIIAGQIADRLAQSPTNNDFIRLLEATQGQARANDILIEQTSRIMTVLAMIKEYVATSHTQEHDTQPYEGQNQERTLGDQPREWEAFGESWRRAPPTPQGEVQSTENDVAMHEEPTEVGDTTSAPTPTPEPDTVSREQAEMPTPRRGPLAYAPGGVVADPIAAVRQASQRNQERGAATRPFRSSR